MGLKLIEVGPCVVVFNLACMSRRLMLGVLRNLFELLNHWVASHMIYVEMRIILGS